MKANQIADDLRAAADVLKRDGWTQGKYHEYLDGRFSHCASGAISLATGEHMNLRLDPSSITGYDRDYGSAFASERSDQAMDALSKLFPGQAVEDWNDSERRTVDEVIAALRAAADRAETVQ